MPRKGENIRQRKDGRWEGRFIDYYRPGGKPHYKSVYGGGYTAVKNMLKTAQQEQESRKTAQAVSSQNISKGEVTAISALWLENAKIKVKESTYARYYTIVETHIKPYFKGISVCNLTDEVVQGFIRAKVNQGDSDCKEDSVSQENSAKLSAKTIRDIFSVLNQIIKYAKKKKYIVPLQYDIVLPKIQPRQLTVLTHDQQESIVRYIQNNLDKQTLGILIALYTGVRLGELCALTWGDIDLEAGELNISKTIQRVRNIEPVTKPASITNKMPETKSKKRPKTKLIIDKPKSNKSIRIIPLPAFLLENLKLFSQNHDHGDYILTGAKKPIDSRTYQGIFKRHMKKIFICDVNFHTTRHTFATRAIEVGFDIKSLSEILGHSSVRFTLDRYVHSLQEQKKICMAKMANCY